MRTRSLPATLLLHLGLLLASGAFLLPLAWMVLTALKPVEQTMKSPPEWIPRVWTAPLAETPSGPQARRPVDRIRRLEVREALVLAGLGPDEKPGEGYFEGQRMLVPAADLKSKGAEWGAAHSMGPAVMRRRLGIEREKRVFACRIQELYEAPRKDETGHWIDPWWQVRAYVPDVRQGSTAPSGAKDENVWSVVRESDLRQEVAFLWQNIPVSLKKMDFWNMLVNTLWVCILGMVGTTLASALAAYGFAFGSFRGKNLIFALTLATMMVPFPATMVPLYQLYRDLGWIGTFKPLWVHCWFGAAFNIFLLRQFFLSLPKDLLDAARIDGCSELEILWHVVVPLSKPVLAMVALFHFLFAWKDFMAPMLYLNDRSQFTLSVGLHAFQSQQGGTPWHLVMAASAVFSLPLIVLYLLTAKTFVRGIAMTGIKG